MAILPVKSPCTLTIIARGSAIVLLVFAGHGGCCKIFGIWNNRLLSNPLWKLVCVILGWVPTRAISLWPEVFLDVALYFTLVTSHIWSGRWPSSRYILISVVAYIEVNPIQILVDLLINCHSICLQKWRLFLRLFFAGSRFPPLWIYNIAVFSCSLLYRELTGCDILLWYDIHVTDTKFLDKLRNLLVLLNFPKTESGVRSFLKDTSDVP